MKRVLLLITDLEIGGTPTVVRELAVRLRASGADVHVGCLKGFGPVARELQKGGVPVKSFTAASVLDLPAVVSEMRAYIRDHAIDTVFSFLIHANTIAAIASRGVSGVRWLQSIQTTQPSPRWHWWMQRIVQHAAEKVVAPSESVAAVARDWADVPADKVVVIPNAVDFALTPSPGTPGEGGGEGPAKTGSDFADEQRPHPALSRSTGRGFNRVGFIGRLDPIKRVPDLLAAVARLPAEVTLDIWGEGAARREIEATVTRLDLAGRVKLHGAIASPASALEQIDCLVLPSAAEGFGLVLIEAMAAGVPVVATNVAGIRDVVRDGHNGLLVPVGDSAALAMSIERVLGEAPLRERLIASGRQTVAERFSWDRVLPMYLHLLGMRTS